MDVNEKLEELERTLEEMVNHTVVVMPGVFPTVEYVQNTRAYFELLKLLRDVQNR